MVRCRHVLLIWRCINLYLSLFHPRRLFLENGTENVRQVHYKGMVRGNGQMQAHEQWSFPSGCRSDPPPQSWNIYLSLKIREIIVILTQRPPPPLYSRADWKYYNITQIAQNLLSHMFFKVYWILRWVCFLQFFDLRTPSFAKLHFSFWSLLPSEIRAKSAQKWKSSKPTLKSDKGWNQRL